MIDKPLLEAQLVVMERYRKAGFRGRSTYNDDIGSIRVLAGNHVVCVNQAPREICLDRLHPAEVCQALDCCLDLLKRARKWAREQGLTVPEN